MNMIKFALLGTAAIAAVSVSARATEASDIAALKAQVEALSAQVASNSAQTQVPAGFELVSVTTAPAIVAPGMTPDKNYAATATTIGIMPTADAPASTVVQWTGFVRAALTYVSFPQYDTSTNNTTYADVKARAELKVTGTTDTAVGEVGAWVKLRASKGWEGTGSPNRGSATVTSPGAWGWWKMTPELSLGGGMDGSIANNGYGYDGACSCYYTDNANASWSHDSDPVQMRLTYASGPMTAAIAIEDYRNTWTGTTSTSTFGVAAKFNYAGDAFSAGLAGGYWPSQYTGTGYDAAWNINAGVKVGLSDMGFLSVNAGIGEDDHYSGDTYWRANALASLNLSEQAHVELGVNRVSYVNGTGYSNSDHSQTAVLAGLYYEPVKQLTIGLEGEYVKNDDYVNSTVYGDLVTVFRF